MRIRERSRLIVVMVCLCSLLATSAALARFGGEGGTEDDPFLIHTADDLRALGAESEIRGYYRLTADLDAFDMTEPSHEMPVWRPIHLVEGVFDGAGHTVANLHYSGAEQCGFFGQIGEDAQVKDLTITRATVQGTQQIGILAGGNLGQIVNCHVSGMISSTGASQIGGLVGVNYGGVITDCSADVALAGYATVGGLVGSHQHGGVVDRCYAIVAITARNDVGGLIGEVREATVQRCYASGVLGGDDRVGGLVGVNNTGILSNCYATTLLSGTDDTGGLVGVNGGLVTHCYSIGGVAGGLGLIGLQASFPIDLTVASFWDVQTSGQDTSDGGMGQTTNWMQTLGLYATHGWSIRPQRGEVGHIWVHPSDGGYPSLTWEWQGRRISMHTFAGGSGTENAPYLLATPEDLCAIGLSEALTDKHFKLVDDIDLSGRVTPMIGSAGIPFTGTFDGAGRTVSHFIQVSSGDMVGLFASVGIGGKVTNLTLEYFDVTGRNNVGGLIGHNAGEVENCLVRDGRVSGNMAVGGGIGWNWTTGIDLSGGSRITSQGGDLEVLDVEVTGAELTDEAIGLNSKPSYSTTVSRR